MANMPYDQSIVSYVREAAPQGSMGYAGSTGPIRLKFIVELNSGNVNCVYGRAAAGGQITNATGTAESKLGISGIWGLVTGGETPVQGTPVCPLTMVQSTRMKFEGPTGQKIYMASR
jgi:hypothetical protein